MALFFILIVIPLVIYINNYVITIQPYEKWILERFSKFSKILEPWLICIIPFVDRVVKMDMRERLINILAQQITTKDKMVVTVDVIILTQIVDPVKTLYEIREPFSAVPNLSIATLKYIIWKMNLDEVLDNTNIINRKLQSETSQEIRKRWMQINKMELLKIDYLKVK